MVETRGFKEREVTFEEKIMRHKEKNILYNLDVSVTCFLNRNYISIDNQNSG